MRTGGEEEEEVGRHNRIANAVSQTSFTFPF